MIFNKLIITGFKQFIYLELSLNADVNILVGDNESGKSTILEGIALATTGRFKGKQFAGFIEKGIFHYSTLKSYIDSLKTDNPLSPPYITIELYARDNAEDADYKGKNNSKMEDAPGIAFSIYFDCKSYGDQYKILLKEHKLNDIPLEFYRYDWQAFSGTKLSSFTNPVSTSIIDAAKASISMLGNYIGNEIDECLSEEEKRYIGLAYRNNRAQFADDTALDALNRKIATRAMISDKKVGLSLNDVSTSEWQKELGLSIDDISYAFVGKGTQHIIKTNLSLWKDADKSNLILIEEPENALSHTNMSKLVSSIIEHNLGKQIFIATHSNFVANKLGLDKIILLHNSQGHHFSNLKSDTVDYFRKLPGYETLRFVLSQKAILVEGPSDELMVQKAYLLEYGKLPIEDGTDVISVRSLAFKRFCDISVLIKKPIYIVTDNDGDIKKNITNKYGDYSTYLDKLVYIFHDADENNRTLEVAFINANKNKLVELSTLFSKPNDYSSLLEYMLENKTEWALQVFESSEKFTYPRYINNAIKK